MAMLGGECSECCGGGCTCKYVWYSDMLGEKEVEFRYADQAFAYIPSQSGFYQFINRGESDSGSRVPYSASVGTTCGTVTQRIIVEADGYDNLSVYLSQDQNEHDEDGNLLVSAIIQGDAAVYWGTSDICSGGGQRRGVAFKRRFYRKLLFGVCGYRSVSSSAIWSDTSEDVDNSQQILDYMVEAEYGGGLYSPQLMLDDIQFKISDALSSLTHQMYFELADCCDGECEVCCEADGSCSIKPKRECDTEDGAVLVGEGTCEACSPCGCEGLQGWPETLLLELLEFSEFVNPVFFGGPPGYLGELPESCISAAATELAAEFNRNASINLTRESVSLDKQSCKYSLRRLTQGPGLGLCEVTGGPFYDSVYFIANVTVACDKVDVVVAVQISTPECEFTIDLSTGQWVTPGIVQHSARSSSPFSCEALSSGLELPAAYAQRVGPTAHDGGCGTGSFSYSVSSPSGMKFRVSFDNPLP